MLDVSKLNPLQRLALRFTVLSLVFYGLSIAEGMILRANQINYDLLSPEHHFAMLTAHPMVGIFGGSYLLVFGAFYYLVPTLLEKPIYSQKLAERTWIFMSIGVFAIWVSGIAFRYAALYTNYWPLPASKEFAPYALACFSIGVILIMIGVLCFCYNIFATVFHQQDGRKPHGPLIMSAFGLDGFVNLYRRLRRGKAAVKEPILPVHIVAIFRGTIDTLLDSIILGGVALLFLFYAVNAFVGVIQSTDWLSSLLYKNIYWFGLDLIADGLVLIYVAGTWYLLATLISKKPLFMQNIARAMLLVELVVSWFVFGHHLLSDQGQPAAMKIVSGELVTLLELVTMGIAIAVTLVTLWRARPLKMTPPLMFLLGGILGFALGVPAGIVQADMGMNRILHNTQWVIGPHAHLMLLVGLGMTLYAALYAIFPMVTNNLELKYPSLTKAHFWLQLVGGVGMSVAMGYAGMNGMLRRAVYPGVDTFQPYMIAAAVFGALLLLAYGALMFNLVSSIGLRSLVEIFVKLPSGNGRSGFDLAMLDDEINISEGGVTVPVKEPALRRS